MYFEFKCFVRPNNIVFQARYFLVLRDMFRTRLFSIVLKCACSEYFESIVVFHWSWKGEQFQPRKRKFLQEKGKKVVFGQILHCHCMLVRNNSTKVQNLSLFGHLTLVQDPARSLAIRCKTREKLIPKVCLWKDLLSVGVCTKKKYIYI